MFTLSFVPNIIRNNLPCTIISSIWKKVTTVSSKIKESFSYENIVRYAPLLIMLFFFSEGCLAQSAAGGFASATTTIKGYQVQVSNLMKAIGAVIAIVGAFNVYFKMTNGDQDVKKTIMLTIGGCIAFVALGEALPLFFE